MPSTIETKRLEIVSEFQDGETYQFSLNNPRFTQGDHVDAEDIEELNTFMLANQPLVLDGVPFARISSATVVVTTKTKFYEAEDGLWKRDNVSRQCTLF